MALNDKAELITIGNELLSGRTIDTNSAWLASQLDQIGAITVRITSVGDTREEILKILHEAGERAGLVIMTGGLGPTSDDVTKPALCEFFDTKLVFSEEVFKHIKVLLAGRNCKVNENNRKQAEIPGSAIPLHNALGTAPGLWFEKGDTIYISLPGVPFEMKDLVTTQVIPRLQSQLTFPPSCYRTIITQGSFEAHLAEILSGFEEQLPAGISLAYYPSPGIIRLKIGGVGEDPEILRATVESEVDKLREIIPQLIVGYDEETLETTTGKLLTDRGETLAVAESCTGGAIASLITGVPGSSAYFKGGIIAYSNEIKKDQLAINPDILDTYGAVSKQVVEDMAVNARLLFNSTYAIAVSGIAGPAGGTPEKPVGTTWIAVSCSGSTDAALYMLGDNRQRNIQRASVTALNMLRKMILAKT
ncbi:MAG: CinA family nicotinamide mononucleotide deamidase-related protein [Marinilabiliales bacterium]|nr:MAG: CinA family nicotinamide mononucleotide deamidase-related protein [Marinilabiliales bacterium]